MTKKTKKRKPSYKKVAREFKEADYIWVLAMKYKLPEYEIEDMIRRAMREQEE